MDQSSFQMYIQHVKRSPSHSQLDQSLQPRVQAFGALQEKKKSQAKSGFLDFDNFVRKSNSKLL